MNIKFKFPFCILLFGIVVCVNLACNASAEINNNEADTKEAAEQEIILDPVEGAEMQASTHQPIVLSEEQFRQWVVDYTSIDKKYKGKKPCVIDFYADWCRPCKILAPTFEKMAEKYGDKVNFYKVDVDRAKTLSAVYSITAIPTLFFYDKKGTLGQMRGLPSEEELENAVKAIMN